MAGSTIVTLALVSYSLAFFSFHSKKILNKKILGFQTVGLLLDITATTLMIIGSSKGPFTFHGILGYSSLTLMIFDTIFFWMAFGKDRFTPRMKLYSKIAYIWWVLAYVTGSLLVILR